MNNKISFCIVSNKILQSLPTLQPKDKWLAAEVGTLEVYVEIKKSKLS